MRINGMDRVNAVSQAVNGIGQAADSYSKNIQRQIADAQKKLQELSSNEDMTLEEKMEKRQEIQQEIANLNQQLRQHQIAQRKEQQESMSMNDMLGGSRKAAKTGDKGSGLSQATMTAMISADSSRKQAEVQGSMAAQMEGRAGVLESEIKMDKGRGANTEKKEEELADLQTKAQAATAAQISTLADAGKVMEEAAKADSKAETIASRNNKSDKNEENDDISVGKKDAKEQALDSTVAQQPAAAYTTIDIRL